MLTLPSAKYRESGIESLLNAEYTCVGDWPQGFVPLCGPCGLLVHEHSCRICCQETGRPRDMEGEEAELQAGTGGRLKDE